jgi:selenide,water dikinase
MLSQVLAELDLKQNDDVKIGLQSPDDAAIIRTYNDEVTVTTDFFAAPFDDPYLVGRIAALNSASDCFVMGAQPTAALAIVQLPQGHPMAQLQIMHELMAGSVQELNKMGAAIVGGHSIEGPRTMIGFTVLGRQLGSPKTKGMLAVGDQLVLTKPLGSGVLLAAWMQSQLPANCFRPLIETMLMSNEIALKLIQDFQVTAITDVTGFGLAGHLAEMLEASQVSASIDVSRIPQLEGCQPIIDSGIESTLAPVNRLVARRVSIVGGDLESKSLAVLFDPQTGGGLLFGIRPQQAGPAIHYLQQNGFVQSTLVGEITGKSETPEIHLH